MVFRRRRQPGLFARARMWVWPDSGWYRAGTYVLMRIKRLPGSPHSIAAGCACGVAISFTPFIGAHVLLALGLCWLVRGNYIAAVVGTLIGNPWTFPFIWALTYELGVAMLGGSMASSGPEELTIGYLLAHPTRVLLPMAVGSLPCALISWLVTYIAVARFVAAFQETRRHRLSRRRRRQFVAGAEAGPVE